MGKIEGECDKKQEIYSLKIFIKENRKVIMVMLRL
jgi:hypothetical protein